MPLQCSLGTTGLCGIQCGFREYHAGCRSSRKQRGVAQKAWEGFPKEHAGGEDLAGEEWVSAAGCFVGSPAPDERRNRPGTASLGHSDFQ